MSLFITGIGTDVGKTVVTAGLAGLLKQAGRSFCVYKPIQTGSSLAIAQDPAQIQQWVDSTVPTFASYCFEAPVAPYVADVERAICPERLLADFNRLQSQYDVLLVEGAGGVRVPIAPQFEMRDLIRMFQLPAVVVASPYLGALNHTLLSVEALLQARIEVLGVIISQGSAAEDDPAIQTFRETLEAFLPAPLLGEIPALSLEPKCFLEPDLLKHFGALGLVSSGIS